MMDLTDGHTRDTALPGGATTDFSLGGYTRAIEQGRHPVWGSNRTAQLEDTTAAQANLASRAAAADATADLTFGGHDKAREKGTHPAWEQPRATLVDNTCVQQASPSSVRAANRMPAIQASASANRSRPSRLGQSPAAATGRISHSGRSPQPIKGRISLSGQSPSAVKGRMSLLAQSPSAVRRAQPEGQKSKWGFVPGEDDTLDLNMEKAGRCFARPPKQHALTILTCKLHPEMYECRLPNFTCCPVLL